MSKVTLKSTKQEILDALHAAEKQLAAQKQIMSAPGEETKKTEEKAIVEAADADVAQGIFSDAMNDKYLNLANAIELLTNKLNTLYGIDAEMADMAVVINAKKQAQLSLDDELEKQKAKIAEELAQAKRDFEAEVARMKSDSSAKKADLERDRKREEEQYSYDLARKRKLDEDAYADKTAAMNKKLADAAEQLAALQSDADAINAMKARIEALPEELEAKYQEGVKDGEKAAGKEYGYKTAMAEKDHAYELRERDGRIERLEADCNEKAAKITSLESKLDAAYAQLRELATKTVESSGGVKVISASGDSAARK